MIISEKTKKILFRIAITLIVICSSNFLIRLCLNAQNSFLSNLFFDIWVLCLASWVFFMITEGKFK